MATATSCSLEFNKARIRTYFTLSLAIPVAKVRQCTHKGPEARQVSLVWEEIFGSICGELLLAAIVEGDTAGTAVALGRIDCVVQECKDWDIDISVGATEIVISSLDPNRDRVQSPSPVTVMGMLPKDIWTESEFSNRLWDRKVSPQVNGA